MDKDCSLHLESFSKELKLLLSIIRLDNDPNAHLSHIHDLSGIDWKLFLKLAHHHRLYPVVYSNIKSHDLTFIPNEVIHELKMKYSKNVFQMLQLSAEMEKVCNYLNQNNIRYLLLKGPVLAKTLYGDFSLRTSKDIDILVDLNDIENTERMLLAYGFHILDTTPRILNDWKWREHHFTYYHPATKIEVELHWRMNPDAGYEPSFEALWERRQSISLSSVTTLYSLGNEDLLFYLVSHGARHGWFRLRWLADIDRLAKKEVDYNKLGILAKHYNGPYLLGQALLLTKHLFLTPLTHQYTAMSQTHKSRYLAEQALFYIKDMVELCTPTLATKALEKHYRKYTFSIKSTSQKMNYLIRRMYPRSTDAEILPLPQSLHFLYFILRPLVILWRRMKQFASY